jgi:two-component system CheB/CheR fusion protein
MLTVISGNLQLLELQLNDGRLKPYLTEADRAVEMAGRLSQRLMTFARQRQLAPVQANLNGVITNMLEFLQRTIGGHITITTALAKDLCLTLVDPGEIENAVLNLAINPRDAMPGGGRLIIETENVALPGAGHSAPEDIPSGSYVRLSVSDTGTGAPPEVLAKAFEPFFTTKGPGKGTGLGLASIYGFVKQSGGNVKLYSEVGHGTTINIYLPKLEGVEPVTYRQTRPRRRLQGTEKQFL